MSKRSILILCFCSLLNSTPLFTQQVLKYQIFSSNGLSSESFSEPDTTRFLYQVPREISIVPTFDERGLISNINTLSGNPDVDYDERKNAGDFPQFTTEVKRYRSQGKIDSAITVNLEGKRVAEVRYHYDIKGLLETRSELYYGYHNTSFVSEKDDKYIYEDGILVEVHKKWRSSVNHPYISEETEFTYEANGKIKTKVVTRPLQQVQLREHLEYFYDSMGRCDSISLQTYNSLGGESLWEVGHRYKGADKPVFTVMYSKYPDTNYKFIGEYQYHYDTSDRLILISLAKNSTQFQFEPHYFYSYTDQNNIETVTTYFGAEPNSDLYNEVRFVYDYLPIQGTESQELELELFPNPVSDGVLQYSCDLKVTEIVIYDSNGAILMEISNPRKRIDVSHFSSGMYHCKISCREGSVTKSFLMK